MKLAINDAGFVFGATVTDLCRTFRQQLFRLDSHLLRFRQSCELAPHPQPRNDNELAAIAQELVRHNAPLLDADHDLALCMFATPGELGYYLGRPGGAGDVPPTFVMYTYPFPFWRYVHLIREGARLVIPKTPQCRRAALLRRSSTAAACTGGSRNTRPAMWTPCCRPACRTHPKGGRQARPDCTGQRALLDARGRLTRPLRRISCWCSVAECSRHAIGIGTASSSASA